MSEIEFLKDLINIPSVSGQEAAASVRVKQEFIKLGYDDIIQVGDNVCGKKGSGRLIVLFDAHLDTVEPGYAWKYDPYKAREENGFIYGRGACDDKGSLAAMIYGAAQSQAVDVTLYVLASVNEEIPTGNGLKEFLEITGIKPDFAVIGEPSSLRVARGNRGRLGIRIDVKGKAGHASSPDSGQNAIYLA